MNKGKVYLIGAGPGDMELLTIKGERLLKSCEVVIYDRLASFDLLNLVPETCERIYVGKTVGNHAIKQEEINEIIVRKALEGKNVVRLKGGDPFVFGRGGEEVLELQKVGVSYEVIPGVTSAIAAATYAGIPITHRGSSNSFHVITGHTADTMDELTDNYESLAKLSGTLVFLMGMSNIDKITSRLMQHGKAKETPVAVISNGTTLKQEVVKGTLETIVKIATVRNIKAPAIIIVGEVASLDMKPRKNGVLANKRIGITGTKHITDKLKRKLEDLGASIYNLSFSKVNELTEQKEFKDSLKNLSKYTWITFTSTNGVDVFFKQIKKEQIDLRSFRNMKFAVVGNGTKEALKKQGFYPDYLPEVYATKDLAYGLVKLLSKEDRLLIPRAKKGSKDFTRILSEHGIPFDDITIYDIEHDLNKRDQLLEDIHSLDIITFASASGVDGFMKDLDRNKMELLNKSNIVCIGDITASRLESFGFHNYHIANEYNVAGMVNEIIRCFS